MLLIANPCRVRSIAKSTDRTKENPNLDTVLIGDLRKEPIPRDARAWGLPCSVGKP